MRSCCETYDCIDPCACSAVDIDRLILESKVTESNLGMALKNKLFHDWTCDIDAEKKIERLQRYRYHLEEEFYTKVLGGKPCLKCDELQLLYERVKKITASCNDLNRPDLLINRDSVTAWIAKNPYCVSREKWEYLVYDILCDLEVEVEIIDRTVVCDIVAEICAKAIPCDIVVAAYVCQKKCDLELKVCATAKQKCALDFDIMIKSKKCDLGLDLHIRKLKCELTVDHCARLMEECNLTMDVISCVYGNGCCLDCPTIEQQMEGQVQAILHTENSSYPFDLLKSEDIPNIEMLSKYGVDLTDSEYLKDPEAFIKKLNRDYSG